MWILTPGRLVTIFWQLRCLNHRLRPHRIKSKARSGDSCQDHASERQSWHFHKKMMWFPSKKLHFADIASCIRHVGKQQFNSESLAKNDTFQEAQKIARPIPAPWSGLERRLAALAACGWDFQFILKLRDDAKEVAGPKAVASGVSQSSKSLQSQATQANEKRKVARQQSCICGSFNGHLRFSDRKTTCFPNDCGMALQLLWFPPGQISDSDSWDASRSDARARQVGFRDLIMSTGELRFLVVVTSLHILDLCEVFVVSRSAGSDRSRL